MKKLLIVVSSFLLVFIWEQTFFSNYYLEELIVLVIIYAAIAIRKKKLDFIFGKGDNIWGIFIINTIAFVFIMATGGISSVFFFFIYLLFFGMGFVVEPFIVIVFLLGTVFVFYPQVLINDVQINFLKLGSLLVVTPLAFMVSINEFGKKKKRKN